MPTGIEMYDALYAATRRLEPRSDFKIDKHEALDLMKLTIPKLVSKGYGDATADEVVSAMSKGDYKPLGRTLGVNLIVCEDAPYLIKPSYNSKYSSDSEAVSN